MSAYRTTGSIFPPLKRKKQFSINLFLAILESLGILFRPIRYMDTAASGLLNRDEMESRRLLAAHELQHGLAQSQVARKFGVSRTTASRWQRALVGKGVESLRKRRAPGRPSRMTQEQAAAAIMIYQAGPREAGFDSDRWTTMRFADAIFARLGIRYDPDHVGRIMHRLGLREARPRRREQEHVAAALPELISTVA